MRGGCVTLWCMNGNHEAVLRVSALTKRYGDIKAVDGISFAVLPGEVVGLLGPNGAGKTTTINMILSVLEPTSGAITIEGEPIGRTHTKVMGRINFAAVYAHVPYNQTVYENLYFFGLLYAVPDLKLRIEELLGAFALVQFRDTRAGLLSSGEQTRVSLAKAFINRPRLLLLDEPTASLDPATARMIREKIRAYAKEERAAILWTSHNMHEVEEECDRVLFMSRGKILLEGDPKTLPGKHGKKNLEEIFIEIAREPLRASDVSDA